MKEVSKLKGTNENYHNKAFLKRQGANLVIRKEHILCSWAGLFESRLLLTQD